MSPTDRIDFDVTSEHLRAETVLLDLGAVTLVSDHPERDGGSGRGPMPGELMKGALASSVVLAVGAAAERGELPLRRVVAQCRSQNAQERLDGPLPTQIWLPAFEVELDYAGDPSGEDLRRAEEMALSCPVAVALSDDLEVVETNVFVERPPLRDARGATLVVDRFNQARPIAGEQRVEFSPYPVTAEYLGEGRAFVTWAHAAFVVEDAARHRSGAASPEALLASSLAACTSVFVARAAAVLDAAVEIRVRCSSRSDRPRIEKRLEVVGELSREQQDVLGFFADHCALGETLRRRATVRLVMQGAAAEPRKPVGDSSEPLCDDGACCLPDVSSIEDSKAPE